MEPTKSKICGKLWIYSSELFKVLPKKRGMSFVSAKFEPFFLTKVGFNYFVQVILLEKLVNFEVIATLKDSKVLHPLLTYYLHPFCMPLRGRRCKGLSLEKPNWKSQIGFSFRWIEDITLNSIIFLKQSRLPLMVIYIKMPMVNVYGFLICKSMRLRYKDIIVKQVLFKRYKQVSS